MIVVNNTTMRNLFTVIFIAVAYYVSMDVQAQASQMGRCRSSISCEAGDIIGMMSFEDCCINTAAGLAFTAFESLEQCQPCIVFGFFNDSFTGVEQEPGHTVQAGWQKGAALGGVNLVFNVINTGITAREGSGFDYTVSTNQVRFLYRRPDPPDNVVFIFRMDAIAQEINETLTLELVRAPGSAALPTGDNVFFRNAINMTIIDTDAVDIFFTEGDFRASEAPEEGALISLMPVRVIKTSRIANPIVLEVIPLTVEMATANQPPPLPTNVPDDNPFSPPFADLNDFNNTIIRITFDPDEDLDSNERPAPIPLVDDSHNEADEQAFIVQLRLIDSVNPGAIDLTNRPASICRIINDDTIRIGFVVPQYTYLEPRFDIPIDPNDPDFIPLTNLTENGPIYLVKEDNVVSEQTFVVVIQISDAVPSGSGFNPAEFNEDYEVGVGGKSVVLQFHAALQRRLFSFMLLNDDLIERTEAFLASSAPEDQAEVNGVLFDVPGFLSPINLFPEAFIIIEDDDFIIIGFKEANCTVDESVGMLEVYVSVSNPPDHVELFSSTDLVIQTVSRSATNGLDYEEISAGNFDVFLTFDDENRQRSFQVTIIDDNLLESLESFNLELRFDTFFTTSSGVILSPNVTTVFIEDDDHDIAVGFINSPYSVFENESQVMIQVGVIEGSLQREVVVSFSTSDLSAYAPSDYTLTTRILTFTNSSTTQAVEITIENDKLFEIDEVFNASLELVVLVDRLLLHPKVEFITILDDDAPVPRVTLSPDSAQISIVDEDVLSFGFQPSVYSVSESADSIDLNIILMGQPGLFVPHVITSTVDGTATGSGIEADYVSIVAQQLSFTSLQTSQTLTVQITSDSFSEFSETVSAVLSSVFLANTAGGPAINLNSQESSRLILNPNTTTVTIDDDDIAIIGFRETVLSVSEDGGPLNFNIGVLSGTLRINVEVDFTTEDRTAQAGLDYDMTISSLNFFDQLVLSVPVSITDDTLFETPETFVGLLSASNLPSNVRLDPTTATATILDNELIIIGFDPADYNVSETESSVTLTVSVLEGTLSEDQSIEVLVVTAKDSAQVPSDYSQVSTVLTFTSSSTTQTVDVTIENNELLEIDEIFRATLELVDGDDATRVTLLPNEASVTIFDDDVAVIGFDPDAYNATEGTDLFVDLNVQLLSGQLGCKVIVLFNTVNGSATSRDDYVGISNFILTFDLNTTIISIPVTINDNNVYESTETFSAALSFVGAPVPRVTLSPDSAQISIIDEDVLSFGFQPTVYSVSESAGSIDLNIFFMGQPGLFVPHLITSTVTETTTGSGIEADYVSIVAQQLAFTSLQTSQTLTVQINSDSFTEFSETFSAVLSSVFLANTAGGPAINLNSQESSRLILNPYAATVTIDDDDVAIIGFREILLDVSENGGPLNFHIGVISGILWINIVVDFTTEDRTAQAGLDYNLTVSSLNFTNQLVLSVPVSITDDELFETPETFVGLLSASNLPSNVRLDPTAATVTILDNELIIIGFDPADYNVSETEGRITLTVSVLEGTLSEDQSIEVRLVTADDSAQTPSDYGQVSAVLTFTSLSTTQTVEVTIENDNLFEVDEVFSASLELVVPVDRLLLHPKVEFITILDNNVVEIGFVEETLSLYEGTSLSITVEVISGHLDREVTLSINTSNGSALSRMNFIGILDYQLTLAPNMSSHVVFIETIDNSIFDGQMKSFTVSLSTREVRVHLVRKVITVNIIDDDTISIGFLNTIHTVNESQGTVKFEVAVLTYQELGRKVEVIFSTSDSAAIANEDYIRFNSLTLTFDSSNLIDVVPVAIINDDSTERVESFSAHLSFPGQPIYGVLLDPNTSVVEIHDNDEVEIGFSSSEYVVSEGDEQISINVRVISGSLQKEVTLNIHIVDPTAQAADDYIPLETVTTVLGSSQSTDISISIIDDDVFELSEFFTVHLSSSHSSGVSLNQTSAKVTILDDDELIFGFSQNHYTVNEDDGFIRADVIFSYGNSGKYQPLLFLSTNNGTAKEEADFEAKLSSPVTFTGSNRVSKQVIHIFSSSSTKAIEQFSVTLDMVTLLSSINGSSLYLSHQERSRLILDPREANITIVDNDVVVIGFFNSSVSTVEGKNIEFRIGVLQGYLDFSVTIFFMTEDARAKAGSDYEETVLSLVFIGETELKFSVNTIADEIPEAIEIFYGKISVEDSLPDNVRLEPLRVEVTIIDNEGQKTSQSGIPINSLAIAVACTMFFTSVVVALVIIVIIVFKKKLHSKKKKKKQTSVTEHDYESLKLPSIPLNPLPHEKEVAKTDDGAKELDVIYEEIASQETVVKIENDGYVSASYKPSDDSASLEL